MPSALSGESMKQATPPMRRTPHEHQQDARISYHHPIKFPPYAGYQKQFDTRDYISPYQEVYQRRSGHHDYISPYMAAYWEQFGCTQPANAYSGYQSKQIGMPM